MNTAAITGTIATPPTYNVHGFVPHHAVQRHGQHRSPRAHTPRPNNERPRQDRAPLGPGDHVAVVGYLHAEPHDMPDRTVWQRVEIVVLVIDHQPAAVNHPLDGAR